VNFDYQSTLIKELEFKKPLAELSYQLEKDPDVLGRVWALNQLSTQLKVATTPASDKEAISNLLAKTVTADKFWAVRYEAVAALAEVNGAGTRAALLSAIKDENARVRARAVTSLASSKDASLASVYQQLLSDQSYGVIRAAALALGHTKAGEAYDSLVKLLDAPSWHNSVRASALSGLTALGDARSLDIALKYAAQGDYPAVRLAGVRLLGAVGKGNELAFALASSNLEEAIKNANNSLVTASAESLVGIGDPRGVELLERLTKSGPEYATSLNQYRDRLKKSLAGG